MYQVRDASTLSDFRLDTVDPIRAVSLAILGVLGLGLVVGALSLNSLLGFVVAILSVAGISALLFQFVLRALELALLVIGGFIPFLVVAALLDQADPTFVGPVLVALSFFAAGIVTGYWRPERIRRGLLVSWAVIVIVLILSFGAFIDSPEYAVEHLGFLVVGTCGPIARTTVQKSGSAVPAELAEEPDGGPFDEGVFAV